MAARVLVTSAGTGASNSIMRSLRAGLPQVSITGCHDDQFFLKNSAAEANYLTPPARHPRWAGVIRRIVDTERIGLVIPTTDADVASLDRARRVLGRRLFLPSAATIRTCRDKYRLAALLRAHGLPAPVTYPVTDLAHVGRIFRQLGRPALVWCRARTGTGAAAALPVRTPAQARGWISYWQDMRDLPATAFTLSEYLPGRDFSAQSLWKDGQLVLIKTYERLSYLGSGSQPALVSSVAALARTVNEPPVVETCARAVRVLDRHASGVFAVDLKEDGGGTPCITEINAGRFSSATNLFDLAGKHNMAATYVELALEGHVTMKDEYDVTDDRYMLRDIDSLPRLFDAAEFFRGVIDVRDGRRRRQLTRRPAGRRDHGAPADQANGQAGQDVHPRGRDGEEPGDADAAPRVQGGSAGA
jgi:carbamoyl-phosphate synthase large subunit